MPKTSPAKQNKNKKNLIINFIMSLLLFHFLKVIIPIEEILSRIPATLTQ
jgi:hypothetical protein